MPVGSVKVLVQELKKAGEFANIRLAVGLASPYYEGENPSDVFAALGRVTTAELKKRLRDVFKQPSAALDKQHQKLTAPLARSGMRAFAAVSRLVPTAEHENVRVDAEFSAYADPDETIGDLFERHFVEASQQIKPILAELSGSPSERATVGAYRSATRFDWS